MSVFCIEIPQGLRIKMAGSQSNKLGWRKLCHKNTSNLDSFPVRVKRQDASIETVMLNQHC